MNLHAIQRLAKAMYDHIDFKPPKSVADAAAKGLDYRKKANPSDKGGLTPAEASKEGIGSGVQRATNLKNRGEGQMTLTAIHRIALQRNSAIASIEEAARLVDRKWDEIKSKDKGNADSRYDLLKFGSIGTLKNYFGYYFTAAIRTYELPPAIRKKVEIAARMATKQFRTPKLLPMNFTGHDEDVMQKFEAEMKDMEKLLQLKDFCEKQKKLSEAGGHHMKVGPFTLVNSGGFSSDLMGKIANILEKASSLIKSHGFGKVLYGDVNVTNQVHSKHNTAAHYFPSSDEIFFRADQYQDQALTSLIHELGHRLDFKFGDPEKTKLLYKQIGGQTPPVLPDPEPGTTLPYKGETLVVEKTEGGKVHLNFFEDPVLQTLGVRPTFALKVPLESFWKVVSPTKLQTPGVGFVTPYAKTNPDENFAEMFVFYCLGKLSPAQKDLFEEAIK